MPPALVGASWAAIVKEDSGGFKGHIVSRISHTINRTSAEAAESSEVGGEKCLER